MDARSWGVRVVAVGALAQAVGIGIDAWLHGRDPELAAREGLFTFTNAGHALLIGGLVLVAVGAVLVLAGPFLYGPNAGRLSTRGLRSLQIGAPIGVVASVVLGFTLASSSTLAEGHAHEAAAVAGVEHTHDETATATETAATDTSLGGVAEPQEHAHGVAVPEQPLDAATRDVLAAELVQARDVAMQYPTVADADAAGYRMVTPYVPLIGAHYIKWGEMDGNFDIAVPEMLLYEGTAAGSRIVGSATGGARGRAATGSPGPTTIGTSTTGCASPITSSSPARAAPRPSAPRSAARRLARATGGWRTRGSCPGGRAPQGVFSPEHPGLV